MAKGQTEPPHPTGLDAYAPAEIARLVENAGVRKARLGLTPLLALSVLAGTFIAFGGAAYTVAMTGVEPGFGPARVLGGFVFSLGLILVVVGGAELFTGNALMVMACVDRRIPTGSLLRNWGIVFLGNAAGALAVAAAMVGAGLLTGPTGALAAAIAEGKLALGPVEAFIRGVLCNALVCLAVWLSMAARTVFGKIFAILWPITAFVALGFEHSIANLYLIPAGLLAGADGSIAGAMANLIPVTAGNIVGGAGGVALSYRLAFGAGD